MNTIHLRGLYREWQEIDKRILELKKSRTDFFNEVNVLLQRLGYLGIQSGPDDYKEYIGPIVATTGGNSGRVKVLWVEVSGLFLVEIRKEFNSDQFRVGNWITFRADLTYLERDLRRGLETCLPVLGGRVKGVVNSKRPV